MSYYETTENITGPDPSENVCVECGELPPAPGRTVCRWCIEDHRLEMAELE